LAKGIANKLQLSGKIIGRSKRIEVSSKKIQENKNIKLTVFRK